VGESAAGAGGGGDGVRVAVLGAGACVLPCFVCGLSPRCGVTAVECDAEVGRRFFAADRVEQGGQLQLLVDDGVAHVQQCARERYDALFVTAGGGGGGHQERLAPPASMATAQFYRAVLRALRPAGVCGVNVLCPTTRGGCATLRELRGALLEAGFGADGLHVAVTGAEPHCNFVLFALSGPDPPRVDADALAARLAALPAGAAAQLDACRTGCRWLTWDRWAAAYAG